MGLKRVRDYDAEHSKLRKQWAPAVERGDVACWRCGRRIERGQSWDLGHDDWDRSVYRGPEHQLCNRRAAGMTRSRRAAALLAMRYDPPDDDDGPSVA